MKFAFISLKEVTASLQKSARRQSLLKRKAISYWFLNRWPHRFALLSWGHMSCKRPHTVKATLTSEEYETLSALAEKAGMTKAEFIRSALIHWNESLDDLVISKNKNGGRSKKAATRFR